MGRARSPMIGRPFHCVEEPAADALAVVGADLIVCANDPPWSSFYESAAAKIDADVFVVEAWDMDVAHLTATAAELAADEASEDRVVVGFGGGTALDTAKFMAWKLDRPLVQIPTITSVDAGFTDAIGIRDHGRVRYIGAIVPDKVVLDLELIRSAPKRLNRAGIGDILSCHTGLFDWKLASDAGHGHPWDAQLAALGEALLDELEEATPDIAAVSADGVRFLADAYRRIGAACTLAGHSRFEEGSEHFWAYSYELATGAHPVHGEVIAFAVCALSHVQGNHPDRARRIVAGAQPRAHPVDLGIAAADFHQCLVTLGDYACAEGLDVSVADLRPIDARQADAAWEFVCTLPRHGDE
jgi:glycerol dehydrogenase-like iron-containing ADH family enzyme